MKLASNEKKMIVYNWQKLYEGGLQKIQIKAMCDFFNPEKLIKNIQKESKNIMIQVSWKPVIIIFDIFYITAMPKPFLHDIL